MGAYDKVEKTMEWLIRKYARSKKNQKSAKNNVVLGRSFSLGSQFQYVLAKNLFEKTRFKVLVDYPISIPGRKQPIYPDIAVISHNKLIALMEIKMDCGWIGDFNRVGLALKEYNKILKNKRFAYKGYDEKESHEVLVHPSCKRIFIIVSGHNHRENVPQITKIAEKNNFRPLVLTEKTHPNKDTERSVIKELSARKKIINDALSLS